MNKIAECSRYRIDLLHIRLLLTQAQARASLAKLPFFHAGHSRPGRADDGLYMPSCDDIPRDDRHPPRVYTFHRSSPLCYWSLCDSSSAWSPKTLVSQCAPVGDQSMNQHIARNTSAIAQDPAGRLSTMKSSPILCPPGTVEPRRVDKFV